MAARRQSLSKQSFQAGELGGSALNTGLLLALAQAAQTSADYSEEDELKRAELERATEEKKVPINPHITPEGRLQAVLEVNRMLHGALTEKKSCLETSQEEIKRLNKLLDRRAVEEPARRSHIDELQARVQAASGEPTGGKETHVQREMKQLQKEIPKVEVKISQVNEDNLVMSEKHRLERARMVEQQARLRTLGKRERELAKHLDYLAQKLNVLANQKREASQESDCLKMDKLPTDFKNLPGMRLNKLVSKSLEQPPPAVVATPTAVEAPTKFKKDDKVRITKDSKMQGKVAFVMDPSWNNLVKVRMEEEAGIGKIDVKSYKEEDLEMFFEDDAEADTPKDDTLLDEVNGRSP